MVDEGGLDAVEGRIDGWQAGFEQRAAQARELGARLAGLTVTAESDDGLVAVTVGQGGRLTGVRLEEGIRGRPAGETAREILAALEVAQAAFADRAASATAETIGADSATGQAVIASFFRPPT
ncbi:hypothetical protein GCM10010435_53060 [Winogradskya consettensis]|uniref:YbaB/EbfC DNA-binding family protein n=1 Tax=Winogradskya consettensis TaxID=113560 RepID=A0A919SGX5_9ACTN|nr:YbaB/EbfC family nucleoid-associated protein [Actinoplanes consettensis]GIM71660.1 hypothetical protein Aco04nite_26380 [Actinoplanes consettensis]